MEADFASKYQHARRLAEPPPTPARPTELEMQALWFGEYFRSPLHTDDGAKIEIVQPGNWNHQAGPDFSAAAWRDAEGKIHAGPVELHLRAIDWEAHGHHNDPAYENTILHVVWEPSPKRYFPATRQFRSIPQVTLRDQLIAPWTEIREVLEVWPPEARRPAPRGAYGLDLLNGAGGAERDVGDGAIEKSDQRRPVAKPGRCLPDLAALGDNAAEVIHAAGAFRLQRKSERWRLRRLSVSPRQVLWEGLAEGLGYTRNKQPMRMVAQRLTVTRLLAMPARDRSAHLFGLAGFLPGDHLRWFPAEDVEWLQPRWEKWWKARDATKAPIELDRGAWNLAGLRPLNRPERRLAALAQILPVLDRLQTAVVEADEKAFATLLGSVRDEFWEHRVTLGKPTLPSPCALLGEERVTELLVNIFWPLVAIDQLGRAVQGLTRLPGVENESTRTARARLIGPGPVAKLPKHALASQGLIQLYQDFCLRDVSGCENCTFPEMVKKWN